MVVQQATISECGPHEGDGTRSQPCEIGVACQSGLYTYFHEARRGPCTPESGYKLASQAGSWESVAARLKSLRSGQSQLGVNAVIRALPMLWKRPVFLAVIRSRGWHRYPRLGERRDVWIVP